MRIIQLFILIFVIGFMSVTAQQKGDEAQIPSYKLKMGFPATIIHIYKITDSTGITRIFSDSSVRKFKRQYDLYFNERAPSSSDKGFLKLDVGIDSLFYKFTDGDAVFEYNSQADNPGAVTFEDLKAISVALGKDFSMTYSPYGEVTEIEGERLDWLKNYVLENGSGMDTLQTFIWLDGISLNRLKYLTDVKKLIYPVEKVYKDSLWTSPITFQIDGMNYYDTAQVKIVKVADNEITIEAKLNNIRAIPDMGRFYGIKGQILPIESCVGTGTYKLVLSSKNTIKFAELKTNVEIKVRIHKDFFTQKINSRVIWDLRQQLKF